MSQEQDGATWSARSANHWLAQYRLPRYTGDDLPEELRACFCAARDLAIAVHRLQYSLRRAARRYGGFGNPWPTEARAAALESLIVYVLDARRLWRGGLGPLADARPALLRRRRRPVRLGRRYHETTLDAVVSFSEATAKVILRRSYLFAPLLEAIVPAFPSTPEDHHLAAFTLMIRDELLGDTWPDDHLEALGFAVAELRGRLPAASVRLELALAVRLDFLGPALCAYLRPFRLDRVYAALNIELAGAAAVSRPRPADAAAGRSRPYSPKQIAEVMQKSTKWVAQQLRTQAIPNIRISSKCYFLLNPLSVQPLSNGMNRNEPEKKYP